MPLGAYIALAGAVVFAWMVWLAFRYVRRLGAAEQKIDYDRAKIDILGKQADIAARPAADAASLLDKLRRDGAI